MPYFFILPAYLLLLFTALAGSWLLRFTRLRPATPYMFGGILGSIPGFVGVNTLLFLLLRLVGQTPATSENGQLAKGLLAGTLVLLGPFVVSAVGIVLGVGAGVYVAWRTRRQR